MKRLRQYDVINKTSNDGKHDRNVVFVTVSCIYCMFFLSGCFVCKLNLNNWMETLSMMHSLFSKSHSTYDSALHTAASCPHNRTHTP